MSDQSPRSGPARRRGPLFDQRFLGMAVMAVIIVILVAVATIILYGMDLASAPRTEQEHAVATAEAEARQQPKQAQSWIDLAYAYIGVKRYGDAAKASASGRKVQDLPAFYLIDATILEQRGKTSEALSAYGTAMAKAKQHYAQLVKQAADAGAKLGVANDDLVNAAIARAQLEVKLGRREDALADYDVALKIDAEMSDILVERGDVKAALGDKAGARADYQAALRYIPGMPEAEKGLKKVGAGQ